MLGLVFAVFVEWRRPSLVYVRNQSAGRVSGDLRLTEELCEVKTKQTLESSQSTEVCTKSTAFRGILAGVRVGRGR